MKPNLHEVAIGWLFAHQGEHLNHDRAHLVSRCAENLHATHPTDVTEHAALLITLKALGEIESRGNNAHIDTNHGTSFAVFVVDPVSGKRYAFTAADLVRLARHAEPTAVTVH